MKKIGFAFVLFVLLSFPLTVFAQASECDSLSGQANEAAQKLLASIKSYGCCTDTIAACLQKGDQTCVVPKLLANEVCFQTSKGKKPADIEELIAQRTRTMASDAKVYPIEVKPEHIWGNPESKIILSVYLCGRCPYCSRHVPLLIRTLDQSPLKDKIAVNLKYFPIKSHDNSTPAALAIEASAQMGRAWDYLIKSYDNFDAFTLGKIVYIPDLILNFPKSLRSRVVIACLSLTALA